MDLESEEILFESPYFFVTKSYVQGHSMLVLEGLMSATDEMHITLTEPVSLVFGGVIYAEFSREFRGLSLIERKNPAAFLEEKNLEDLLSHYDPAARCFVIYSARRQCNIIASILEFDTPSSRLTVWRESHNLVSKQIDS